VIAAGESRAIEIILAISLTAMTEASQPFTANNQDVETIYTTAASQGESTDWLTVVRNLRQSNRKLLEQAEALEMTIVEAKNEAVSHQERSRAQGIKIIQQDDDLKVAQERVSNLFEQLENSHRIGQRQQILVETLSQKLEIAQTVITEMETENQQLKQQQAESTQRLNKAEAVAQELYRRLKQHVQGLAEPAPPINSTIPKVQSLATEDDDDDLAFSSLSGPLAFEAESIHPGWPAPAVEAAAEFKAHPPSTINLPKFQKKSI
jgi:chromosome segregation ATPase